MSEIRKEPTLYALAGLLSAARHSAVRIGGEWVPARPIGFQGSPIRRLQIAWLVFTGRAGAVVWPAGQ